MRRTIGIVAGAVLAAAMMSPAAAVPPPQSGSLDQTVVPSSTIDELGPVISDVNVRAGAFGHLADGTPVGYIPSNGEPATFNVVDLRTGASLFSQALPGYTMLGSVHISTDGTVYFNGQNPTPGALFRYFPEEQRLEHIGDALGGQSWLRDADSDQDGTLYMSTYPDAKLLAYQPSDGSIRDYGNVSADAAYGYSVEVVGDEVWVGTGTVPHIIAVNKISGAMREIPIPAEHLSETNYVINLTKRDNLVFAALSPRGGFETLVYDLDTNSWAEAIPKVSVSGLTQSDDDGRVFFYAGRELRSFDLATRTSQATTFGSTPLPKAIGSANTYALGTVELGLPDFPGTTVVGVTNTGMLYFYDPETGATRTSMPDIAPAGVVIVGLGVGPDGNIYAGGKVGPNALGKIDVQTHELSNIAGPSQAEGIGSFGDLMVIGTYTGAGVFAGDLSEPWQWGTNPKQLFALGRGAPYFQDRVWTMTDAETTLALGTIPEPGQNGGALVLTDPRTGEYTVHRDLIPGQSIVSLTYRDGIVYGATAIHGGTSTPPIADEAVLFAWDVAADALLWQFSPLPDAPVLGALTWGPDGSLWGVAERGEVFSIDVASQTVLSTTRIVTEDAIPDQHPWAMYSSLSYDVEHDGFVGTVGWKMFFIDRQSLDFGFLRQDQDSYRVIRGGNGDLFCVGKSAVCSVTLAPAPADTVAPQSTLSYRGNNWVDVTLSAEDDLSEVRSIEWRSDDGDWAAYESPLRVKRSDRLTISYRATDEAGNVETAKCVRFTPGEGAVDMTIGPDSAEPCG